MLRLLLAHFLSLLATPVAAIGAVLLLARASGRLTRWHSASGGSDWMFSMPLGGTGWQIGSALGRAVAVFGIARVIFGLPGAQPTVVVVVALTLILASWDVHRFRLGTRPLLSPPPQAVTALRLKIVAGLLASAVVGLLFLWGSSAIAAA